MSDPKSKLQQLLQKNGEDVPEYSYSSHITKANCSPLWNCEIIAKYRSVLYKENVGPCVNKKEAGQNAAEALLGIFVRLVIDDYEVNKAYLEGVKIYIDYENYHDDNAIDHFKDVNKFENLFKVCNKKHPSRDKADIIVDSQHKDATDTVIIVQAGQDLLDEAIKKIFIISHDHFASTISDLYTKIYHVISIKEMMETLKEV